MKTVEREGTIDGMLRQRETNEQNLKALEQKIKDTTDIYMRVKKDHDNLLREIKKMQNNPPPLDFSLHAFIRYLERHLGLDMDMIKSDIITPEFNKMVGKSVDGTFHYKGLKIVIRDRVIITVMD